MPFLLSTFMSANDPKRSLKGVVRDVTHRSNLVPLRYKKGYNSAITGKHPQAPGD